MQPGNPLLLLERKDIWGKSHILNRHATLSSVNQLTMKPAILYLASLLLCFPLLVSAQTCDCESNFEWVKKTFEENDAGFAYALENKGETAYEQHTALIAEKVKEIEDLQTCSQTLLEWMQFFRSAHLGIQLLNQGNNASQGAAPSEDEIRAQFKDWETAQVELGKFKAYLAEKEEMWYEGIWVSGVYKIAIEKVEAQYIGSIIEADGVYWQKGQVKLKIHPDGSSSFYMRDHSEQTFEPSQTRMLGESVLQLGFITLERSWPEVPKEPALQRYLTSMDAQEPYFERVNEQTVMMRIPSFNNYWKPAIDSVIRANLETITQTPNFILDLRDNGGGSDGSYGELLPILYTNPIRTVGVELLSTPLNNGRMLDFINNPDYNFSEEDKKWAQEAYDTLSNHIGEFVSLNEDPVSVTRFDTVYSYPANVGILINGNNGSTTEQFLLAAKQSRKVKLFGTTTYGVLDISNMHFANSPCEEFQLGYSLSRSMRIPDMTIDEKGIQPDFYLGKGVMPYEWIDFVVETFE